jgi:hypothetical protein
MKYMLEVAGFSMNSEGGIRVTSRCVAVAPCPPSTYSLVGLASNNIEDVWDTVGYFLIALSSTALAPSSAMIRRLIL